MKKNNKNRILHVAVTTQNIISVIFLSLIAIMTLTFCIIILLRNASLRNQNEAYQQQLGMLQEKGYYKVDQVDLMLEEAKKNASKEARQQVLGNIKSKLEAGNSTASVLRNLFEGQILVQKDGRYYFVPIDSSLKMNNFKETDFTKNDKGILEYHGSSEKVSGTLGIDVSRFQEDIDWESVAKQGVSYAFIRVGNRGTSTGKLVEDEKFKQNVEGALQNGISVGVYIFSSAINEAEIKEEAELVLDAIEPYEIKYPVVIDVERPNSKDYRTQDLSKDDYTKLVKKFCNIISKAGYTPMIYGNIETFSLILDMKELEGIQKWIAYYNMPQYFPYDFTYWQYSSKGTIDGVKGQVDLNIMVK